MSKIDTMGDVLGDDFEDDITDGDVLGDDDFATVGAARRNRMAIAFGRRAKARAVMLGRRPAWRRELAPGVPLPGEGLEPIPLVPSAGGGIFDPALGAITYQARPQRPFRSERLVATIRRSAGALGVSVQCQAIFVGATLGQAQVGAIDLDIFTPGAFGVRLCLPQAEPGVDIVLPCSVLPAVPAGESVSVALVLLGRTVR